MSKDRMERVVLVLDGLLPIVAMELGDVPPSDEECDRVVHTLTMADHLPGDTGSLAAVAKALHWIAGCPGGAKVFGNHYVREGPGATVARHELGACADCVHWSKGPGRG